WFRGCRLVLWLPGGGGLGGEGRREHTGDPVALPGVRIRKLTGRGALGGRQHRAGPAGPDHAGPVLVRFNTPLPVIPALDRLEVTAQPPLDVHPIRAGHERGGAFVTVVVGVSVAGFCHRVSCSLAHSGTPCSAGPPMSLIRLGCIPGSGLSGSTAI